MSIRKIIWNDLLLTGLKSDRFKYEILLPASYYMVYSGFEHDGLKHINSDIDYNIIDSDKFNGVISVINMNFRPVGDIGALEFFENNDEEREQALNIYKRICGFGNLLIRFDENRNIKNILTMYISRISLGRSKVYYGDEQELLLNKCLPIEDFIAREQY